MHASCANSSLLPCHEANVSCLFWDAQEEGLMGKRKILHSDSDDESSLNRVGVGLAEPSQTALGVSDSHPKLKRLKHLGKKEPEDVSVSSPRLTAPSDSTSRAAEPPSQADEWKDRLEALIERRKASRLTVEKHKSPGGDNSSGSGGVPLRRRSAAIVRKGRVAVDEHCPLRDHVHVLERSGLVYNAMLTLADVSYGVKGHNKFFLVQLLEADVSSTMYLWTRWGRVGVLGQSSLQEYDTEGNAISAFRKKFHDKTRNEFGAFPFVAQAGKYLPIEVDFGAKCEGENDDPRAASAKCSLPAAVQHVVKRLCDRKGMERVLLEFDLDVDRMPLGKLTRAHITKGYNCLGRIHDLFVSTNHVTDKKRLVEETNTFYSLVPHNFGFGAPPVIDSMQVVDAKMQMLESMADIEIAQRFLDERGNTLRLDVLDFQYKQLGAELVPLGKSSEEFVLIEKYVARSHAPTHDSYKLRVVSVFSVCREGEDSAFSPFLRLWNHQLLWHGSRATNLFGILKSGLRIAPPGAPSTGFMFGRGIYFTDMVSKAANYTHIPQTRKAETGFLLLVRVALGNPYELKHSMYLDRAPDGTHSTWGVGRMRPNPVDDQQLCIRSLNVTVPVGEPIAAIGAEDSELSYNEYVVYDRSQIRIEFLVEVEFEGYKV